MPNVKQKIEREMGNKLLGKAFKLATCVLVLSLSPFVYAADGGNLAIDIVLSPAGSFKAETSDVTGFAVRSGNEVKADNVIIDLKSLKTGIGLRDKHTKERLLVDKYPQAKLLKASGKDGVGKATLLLRGQKHDVSGKYEIKDDHLVAQFPVTISQLGIKDVRYMGVGVKDIVTVNITLPIKEGGDTLEEKMPEEKKAKKVSSKNK